MSASEQPRELSNAQLNDEGFNHLRRNGWAVFPDAAWSELVKSAITAIKADCAHNYDPGRQREYDNISFCPDLRDKPPISELLTHSMGRTILDRALGWDKIDFAPRTDRNKASPQHGQALPTCTAYRRHRQQEPTASLPAARSQTLQLCLEYA